MRNSIRDSDKIHTMFITGSNLILVSSNLINELLIALTCEVGKYVVLYTVILDSYLQLIIVTVDFKVPISLRILKEWWTYRCKPPTC